MYIGSLSRDCQGSANPDVVRPDVLDPAGVGNKTVSSGDRCMYNTSSGPGVEIVRDGKSTIIAVDLALLKCMYTGL
jgi:hypothetical protein